MSQKRQAGSPGTIAEVPYRTQQLQQAPATMQPLDTAQDELGLERDIGEQTAPD